jgi:hypothetical protein
LSTDPPTNRAARRQAARLSLAAAAPQVLADDRDDDQTEGGEPHKVDPRLALARETEDGRQRLADSQQGEGDGEGDEQ